MNCKEHHDRAMHLASLADSEPDSDKRRELFLLASHNEHTAAEYAGSVEPSRSVLYRSAAWLALNGKRPEKALKLAGCGLNGDEVPAEIRDELIEVAKAAMSELTK